MRSDHPVRLSVMSDRHKYAPRGILGGGDGSRTRIEFRDGTRPHQKGRAVMQPGELLRLHFPGGGGFGDPAERDPAAIEDDIAKGYVSVEAARSVYGYEG